MSALPDPQRPRRSRSKTVKPGRLPVSEATSDRAGAGSPFGDDIVFPVPPAQLAYEHPNHASGPGHASGHDGH